jgi:hypothetical protein
VHVHLPETLEAATERPSEFGTDRSVASKGPIASETWVTLSRTFHIGRRGDIGGQATASPPPRALGARFLGAAPHSPPQSPRPTTPVDSCTLFEGKTAFPSQSVDRSHPFLPHTTCSGSEGTSHLRDKGAGLEHRVYGGRKVVGPRGGVWWKSMVQHRTERKRSAVRRGDRWVSWRIAAKPYIRWAARVLATESV